MPPDGKKNLVADIAERKNDDELFQLSLSLVEGLLYRLKAHGKTPSITPSPRTGYKESVEKMASQITESARRNSQKWLKKACLSRDGNRCVISGSFDYDTAVKLGENHDDEIEMELAHIIPFSVASYGTKEEHHTTSEIWANLVRYFPSLETRIGFTAESINDTRNAMTMDSILHKQFGNFRLALEPTSQENVYHIQLYRLPSGVKKHLPSNDMVTFRSHDPRYELPSAVLLGIHATVARILHVTGKGEEAERILREKEDIGVLASDGSTNVSTLLSLTNLSSRTATEQKPTNTGPHQPVDDKRENIR